MEDSKSSGKGCLVALLATPVALVFVGWASWDVPVGVTAQGNQMIIGDYISAMNPFELFSSEQAKAPTPDVDNPGLKEFMDPHFFELLNPGVTTFSALADVLKSSDLQSSSNFGGVRTESYLYRNADGSTVFLVFQDGVLISKSENGLQ